jgi:hypothetical protein
MRKPKKPYVPWKLAQILANNAGLPLQNAAHLLWQMQRFDLTDSEIESIVSQPIHWRKVDYNDYVFCHTCGIDVPRELAMGNNPYYCSPACKEASGHDQT